MIAQVNPRGHKRFRIAQCAGAPQRDESCKRRPNDKPRAEGDAGPVLSLARDVTDWIAKRLEVQTHYIENGSYVLSDCAFSIYGRFLESSLIGNTERGDHGHSGGPEQEIVTGFGVFHRPLDLGRPFVRRRTDAGYGLAPRPTASSPLRRSDGPTTALSTPLLRRSLDASCDYSSLVGGGLSQRRRAIPDV